MNSTFAKCRTYQGNHTALLLPLHPPPPPLNTHATFLRQDAFKLPADMTGYAWTMYSIAQAVTFPTIGFLSDRAPGAAAAADGSPAAADAPASRRRRVMLLAFLPWLLAWYAGVLSALLACLHWFLRVI